MLMNQGHGRSRNDTITSGLLHFNFVFAWLQTDVVGGEVSASCGKDRGHKTIGFIGDAGELLFAGIALNPHLVAIAR